MKVVLQGLTKKFPPRGGKGEGVVAVKDFSFEIPDGKLVIKANDVVLLYDKHLHNENI